MYRMARVLIFVICVAAWAQNNDFSGSFTVSLDDGPVAYQLPPKDDPIALLQARLDQGEVKLEWDDHFGYLKSLLKTLGIPASSQSLVFSKTSFQLSRISPEMPRALYFNDDVYVGWVQGGEVMEVSSADPVRGGMFYTMEQKPSAKPRFARRDECLQCHASPKTTGVPGHLVRSVYATDDGYPLMTVGSFVTDDRSPFSERWGGWYVTGQHGRQRHMGNVFVADRNLPDKLDTDAGANVADLSSRLDVTPYLTPHSDIVGLMVLAHQTKLHNLIARVQYEARAALATQAEMNKILGKPMAELSESTARRLDRAAEILARYMVFADEVKLTDPVVGSSSFVKDFEALGPRDKKGRSLREFDLKTRMFRYPCSYLIYTPAFDALPAEIQSRVYRKMAKLMNADDRRAVFEILAATKKGAPSLASLQSD